MRRTVNISMPEEMYEYLEEHSGYLSISEYVRRLISDDRHRSAERKAVVRRLKTANESAICGRIIDELRRVIKIIEGEEPDLD